VVGVVPDADGFASSAPTLALVAWRGGRQLVLDVGFGTWPGSSPTTPLTMRSAVLGEAHGECGAGVGWVDADVCA
jgi:hypothetical protein